MLEGQVTRDPLRLLVRRLWNAGCTLSEAANDHRVTPAQRSALIVEWRQLKQRFRHRSLPVNYLHGWRARQRDTEKENAELVTIPAYGLTYGNWSGRTGPGKKLRDLCTAERATPLRG